MPDATPADLEYPMPEPPAPGTAARVAPGVHWVRMPLPFALDHINVWLLEDGDGWTVVDTGVDGSRTRRHWEELFVTALGGRPITRVVVTHFHPDHVGLAGWLVDRWNAEFCCSLTEWLYGRLLRLDTGEDGLETIGRFYRRAGIAASTAAELARRNLAYVEGVGPLPSVLSRLREGGRLATGEMDWQVVVGRGHTPEQVCLHCPDHGVLIAGDQILPRISPNVSVWASEPDADPLADFLESLDRLSRLPADTLVLPSHGEPFLGLRRRAGALARHHEERLAETLAACRAPRTAFEVTGEMFRRRLDEHQLMFAVGEALAHLNHLVVAGRLRRVMDAQGCVRFVQA